MKFINVLVLIVLFNALQSIVYAQQSVEMSKLGLMKTGKSTRSLISGGTSRNCIEILGKPSGISDVYSEIDEDTLKLYHYGKNRLFFRDGNLTGFEINDASVSMGEVNGKIFKIGDKLKVGNGVKSFLNYTLITKPGISRNHPYEGVVILYLKKNGIQWDQVIELLFNDRGELFNIGFYE